MNYSRLMQQTKEIKNYIYQLRTKTQTRHKSHPIQSLHKPVDQPQEGRNQEKKEFNFETRKKETSSTVNLKNNSEKAEKYCTNEAINLEHRSPNK